MTCKIPVTVQAHDVVVRERNRSAGFSYGARTLETLYVATFPDGSTAEEWWLPVAWRPFYDLPAPNNKVFTR